MIKRELRFILIALFAFTTVVFSSFFVSAENYCATDYKCYPVVDGSLCAQAGTDSGGNEICQNYVSYMNPVTSCFSDEDCKITCSEAQCSSWGACFNGYQACQDTKCKSPLYKYCGPSAQQPPSGTYYVGDVISLSSSAYSPPGGSVLNIYVNGVKLTDCFQGSGSAQISTTCNYVATTAGEYSVSSLCIENAVPENIGYPDCSINTLDYTFTAINKPAGIGESCNPFNWCTSPLQCSGIIGVCQQVNVDVGGTCGTNQLCASGLSCNSNVCQQTDIQVGGTCGTNQLCASGLSCTGGICTSSCTPTTCAAQGVTCGTISDGCGTTLTCGAACVNPVAPTCSDGIMNGQETGIDCGGSCNACTVAPTCSDGIMNGQETGIDCGGSCNACTVAPPVNPEEITFSSAKWANMIGGVITQADKEDMVLLQVSGNNIAGKNVEFVVKKDEWLFINPTYNATTLSASDNNLNLSMRMMEAGDYFFKASVGSVEITSGKITILSEVSNAIPTAIIVSPTQGDIYFMNSNVQFSHASQDIDDLIISETWSFGDGTTGTGVSTTKSYSTVGQKTIGLEVVSSRGQRGSATREINIANNNGYTLFVGIDSPADNAIIPNGKLSLNYNAEGTYVINTVITQNGDNTCNVQVTCIQGRCPSTVRGPNCLQTNNGVASVSGGSKGYDRLQFNWTFKEGKTYLNETFGNGAVSGVKGFASIGYKNITLKVKYLDQTSLQGTALRGFLLLNRTMCSDSGSTFYQVENGFVSERSTLSSSYACRGVDGIVSTSDDCCPTGFMCSSNGCVQDPSARLGCQSYDNSVACNADVSQRVRSDILWNAQNCGKTINGTNILCSCVWDSNKCKFNSNRRSDSDIDGTVISCAYSTTSDSCTNGYQEVVISSTGADISCVSERTVLLPCGKPVVALPFVGKIQLAIMILIIIGVYIILRNLRFDSEKNKSSRKSKR